MVKLVKQQTIKILWSKDCECFKNAEQASLIFKHNKDLKVLEVPQGFKHDGASVPRVLWSITGLSPAGEMSDASFFHDFLYVTKGAFRDIKLTRLEVDKLFKQGLKYTGVSRIKRNIAYLGVRIGGGFLWKREKQPLESFFDER